MIRDLGVHQADPADIVRDLAQVATRARHHLRVTKTVRGGRARAAVEVLNGEAQVAEVARMLGGDSPAALSHARENFSPTYTLQGWIKRRFSIQIASGGGGSPLIVEPSRNCRDC